MTRNKVEWRNSAEALHHLPAPENLAAADLPPLVSVIIPAYNSCRFVAQALDSVLAQVFRNLQVIVIDDGSSDGTLDAIEPYGNSIVVVRTPRLGPAGARNAGIRRASGQFIAFLDSDDLWLPEKVDLQIEYLRRHPDIGIVFCDAETFGYSSGDTSHARCGADANHWGKPGATLEKLLDHRPIALSSVVVRRSCLDRAGLFDESLLGAEDYNLFLRLSRSSNFGFMDRVLVRKRSHDSNLSNDLACMHRDEITSLHKIARLFPEERLRVRKLSGHIHFRFGKYYFSRKQFARARLCFLRSLFQRPMSRWAWVYLAAASLPETWRRPLHHLRKRALS